MAFDDMILRKIDKDRARERREKPREAPRNHLMEQAHQRAREIFNDRDYSIQAPDFFELYTKESVVQDVFRAKQKMIESEASYTPERRQAKMISEVFEAIMLEQAELSDWLGDNVSVLKTSIYDDYFNGTDMIAEWIEPERESNVLALGVDVTFGKASIERKLERVRRDVESGKLGTIKYFQTSDDSFRGQRKGIPHVVIGVDRGSVEQLADLWIRNDKKALAAHPVQRALIEEIYLQLQTIQSHALAHGQREVAEAYRRSLAIMERVRDQKSSVPLGDMEKDRVYTEILNQCRNVFRA
jgi:hypothetical protein